MRYLYIFCLMSFYTLFGQGIPQGFSHRGIIYDSKNEPIVNKEVFIRTTILDNEKDELYIETHKIMTSTAGQYSIIIGQGKKQYPNNYDFKLGDLDWGDQSKTKSYRIEVDITGKGDKYTIIGNSQFLSVPYALFSLSTLNANKTTNLVACDSCIENISSLRQRTPIIKFERICVKNHTFAGDGGGGTFIWIPEINTMGNTTVNIHVDISMIRNDDDGCIIKKDGDTSKGRWVRIIDGYIDVKYYGTVGQSQPDDGVRIQKAIDFAAFNAKYNPLITKGSIVFVSSGYYAIKNELILKNGVSIKGESRFNTVFGALYTENSGGNLMKLDTGRVIGCNISDISFQGNASATDSSKTKNCFNFEATTGEFGDGGLWNSTIKNIEIKGFNGNGIILKGRNDYAGPIQFNVFENISVTRQTPPSYSLYTNGQLGQNTFINCGFFAYFNYSATNPSPYILGTNVLISNATNNFITVGIMSFINCTIENSEDGVNIQHAESVTFDTCWFESLNVAIQIHNGSGGFKSQGINIKNCRFANAAGFGSLRTTAFNGFGFGKCVVVSKSVVNIENCYSTVSRIYLSSSSTTIDTSLNLDKKLFIYNDIGNNTNSQGVFTNSEGVYTKGNSFQHTILSNTFGLVPSVSINSNNSLTLKNNTYCDISGATTTTISLINSDCLPGEKIILTNSNAASITFNKNGNLSFSTITVVLATNKTAEFVKRQLANGTIVYQLISVY